MSFFKKLKFYIKQFDLLFKKPVLLYHEKNKYFKTFTGGLFTLLISSFMVFYLINGYLKKELFISYELCTSDCEEELDKFSIFKNTYKFGGIIFGRNETHTKDFLNYYKVVYNYYNSSGKYYRKYLTKCVYDDKSKSVDQCAFDLNLTIGNNKFSQMIGSQVSISFESCKYLNLRNVRKRIINPEELNNNCHNDIENFINSQTKNSYYNGKFFFTNEKLNNLGKVVQIEMSSNFKFLINNDNNFDDYFFQNKISLVKRFNIFGKVESNEYFFNLANTIFNYQSYHENSYQEQLGNIINFYLINKNTDKYLITVKGFDLMSIMSFVGGVLKFFSSFQILLYMIFMLNENKILSNLSFNNYNTNMDNIDKLYFDRFKLEFFNFLFENKKGKYKFNNNVGDLKNQINNSEEHNASLILNEKLLDEKNYLLIKSSSDYKKLTQDFSLKNKIPDLKCEVNKSENSASSKSIYNYIEEIKISSLKINSCNENNLFDIKTLKNRKVSFYSMIWIFICPYKERTKNIANKISKIKDFLSLQNLFNLNLRISELESLMVDLFKKNE